MRKWIFIIVIALLVAAPVALIGVLLYTQAGVGLISTQLGRLERFGVHIEGLSGTLSGPLRIERLEIDNPNVHIVTHDIVAYLQLRELLVQTIRISSMTTRDTLVEIRTAPPTPPSTKPPGFLPSFMRIDARSLEFTRLRYVNIDGTVVNANSLRGRARISPRQLRVGQFQVDAPQFNVAGEARLRAQRPMGLELAVNGKLRMERDTELVASARVNGTIEQLAINASMQQPNIANVEALFTRPDGHWRIEGQVTSPSFLLDPWMDNPPLSLRNVALKIDARPQSIHVAGNVGIPQFDSRDLTIDTRGKFAARVLSIESADIAINESPARLHAAGSVAFDGEAPTLDLALRWNNLQWPLHAAAMVSSADGKATLRGPLPYEYTVDAKVIAPQVGESAAIARGSFSKEEVTIAEYQIATLNGSVAGDAMLQFKQPRAWNVEARATDIDPARINAQFPGRISFNVKAKGQGLDSKARFAATVESLSGTLRNERLRGNGFVARDANGWRVQRTNVSLGDARLALDGTLHETIDARWSLQAQSLQTLLPQAQGKVAFTGTAQGPVKKPHVTATLHGEGLGYNTWRVAQLDVEADVDAAGGNPSRLSLRAQRAGQRESMIDSLRITGDGVAEEHRLNIEVIGVADAPSTAAPRAVLDIVGRYVDAIWNGAVRATDITDGRKSGERLVMNEAANIVIGRDRASLDKLCIALGKGQFCADGKWQRNGPWEGTLSGYEIPLAAVLPPSGDQAEYAGRIEGRAHASGAPGQPWQGEAGARIIDAAIVYRPPGAEPETLSLGNGGLAATATAAQIDFSLGIQAFADTFLYANARIARNGSNDLLNLPLTGDVRARAADANILPIVVADIDNAAGLLTANLNVRGTLAAPEIDGRVELTNGELDSYRVNLALRELNLAADLANRGLDFKGSGRAGDGRLDVGGHLTWREGESRGELRLSGQNLLVSDLPEYRVVASPDLKFRIDGRNLEVTGDVTIPSASIKPVVLTGAVQASDDARYVGEHPAERAGQFTVHSEIRITMGDDVRIDAFGLQGRMTGGVTTTIRTDEVALGRGELSVADGRYEAYGQKLDITRGRLLFEATSLDDPALDIEAKRKLETVEVGLNVRGTLRAPRLTFFSDPSMPQTSIVSYLLVGKPIDDMQSSDRAKMSSARDTLSVQGGGVIASQLGRRLGLDEVGVESSTGSAGQSNQALVLGKFLSPRLFISYGISLTESINTLKLRYTITDRWILKMEAGENQSADAEYTIER